MSDIQNNHLEDRYVVQDENGQHYGNYPTLMLAEQAARHMVIWAGGLHYMEVTYNGVVFYRATS